MALMSLGPDSDQSLARTARLLAGLAVPASISLSRVSFRWYGLELPETDSTLVPFLRGQQELRSLVLAYTSTNVQVAGAIAGMQALRELNLSIAYSASLYLQTFFEALAGGSTALQNLDLNLLATNRTDKISIATIRPLLRLTSLKVFSLYSSNGLNFEDKDVQEMGLAWQQAELLDLSSGIPSSRILLSVLNAFASNFGPSLAELRMEVSVGDIPTLEAHAQRFQSLRTLHLGWSPAPKGREEQMATFLARICPPTTDIKHSARSEQDGDGGWDKVMTIRASIYDTQQEPS